MLPEDTPSRIAVCSDGLDSARLALPPGPRLWSALDILAHHQARHMALHEAEH